MSFRTVMDLSARWHEAVATAKFKASNFVIPPPWFPAAAIDDYQIVRVESAEELYREGVAMHNCVGIYDRKIATGSCYIYSV
jgi:hypothetical protein